MSASIQTGAVVLERYRIDKELGVGGMGAVFEATHTITGKRVALKWLKPERAKDENTRRRLLREARIAAKVEHPNTVDIYDVGTHDGAIFLVMELLRGESLGAWLRRRGAVPYPELVQLMLPALRGIAALHAAGVVHRDLKPDNIFLCEGLEGVPPQAKILDFGIATATETNAPKLTDTGAILGTPAYMAPEQLQGDGIVDGRADVYAVGVILYLGLTGNRPFQAENIPALVGKVLYEDLTPPSSRNPEVPAALSSVVMRAMARDLDARYPDIASLAEALSAFVETSAGVSSQMGAVSEPVPAPTRGSSALVWAGIALAAALIAAMVLPLLLEEEEHAGGDVAPAATEEPAVAAAPPEEPAVRGAAVAEPEPVVAAEEPEEPAEPEPPPEPRRRRPRAPDPEPEAASAPAEPAGGRFRLSPDQF